MKVITIEGPSGAGKSTLIKKIISKNPKYKISGRLSSYLDKRKYCPEGYISEYKFNLTFNCNLIAWGEEKKYLTNHKNNYWLQDRNWVSTLTNLHAIKKANFLKVDSFVDSFIKIVLLNRVIIPNILIYLNCPPELTKKRRHLRGSSAWGDVPRDIDFNEKEKFRRLRYTAYVKFIEMCPIPLFNYKGDFKKMITSIESENYKNRVSNAQIVDFIKRYFHNG